MIYRYCHLCNKEINGNQSRVIMTDKDGKCRCVHRRCNDELEVM